MSQTNAKVPALLIVEDDQLIALELKLGLRAAGFSIVTASSGAKAIKHLDEHAGELEALVTDIQLGEGPTGWEVARHARKLNPELPVVYVSGDAGQSWESEGVPESVFIQKPYASSQIVTAVSMLLIRTG